MRYLVTSCYKRFNKVFSRPRSYVPIRSHFIIHTQIRNNWLQINLLWLILLNITYDVFTTFQLRVFWRIYLFVLFTYLFIYFFIHFKCLDFHLFDIEFVLCTYVVIFAINVIIIVVADDKLMRVYATPYFVKVTKIPNRENIS